MRNEAFARTVELPVRWRHIEQSPTPLCFQVDKGHPPTLGFATRPHNCEGQYNEQRDTESQLSFNLNQFAQFEYDGTLRS